MGGRPGISDAKVAFVVAVGWGISVRWLWWQFRIRSHAATDDANPDRNHRHPGQSCYCSGTTQPTQQFTATGTYSDGSTKVLTSTANWLSSNPAVATVNTTGLATGMTAGTTTISATSGTITGTTVLTVNPAPLVSIAVTPATATVAPNGTQQFTATGTYADHSTQNITSSVTWSASVGATITAGGLATGVTPGNTATIMATLGGVSGTATLDVTNPVIEHYSDFGQWYLFNPSGDHSSVHRDCDSFRWHVKRYHPRPCDFLDIF